MRTKKYQTRQNPTTCLSPTATRMESTALPTPNLWGSVLGNSPSCSLHSCHLALLQILNTLNSFWNVLHPPFTQAHNSPDCLGSHLLLRSQFKCNFLKEVFGDPHQTRAPSLLSHITLYLSFQQLTMIYGCRYSNAYVFSASPQLMQKLGESTAGA